ncbi:hypothetical protein Gotur_016593 [Gossypium turneri]
MVPKMTKKHCLRPSRINRSRLHLKAMDETFSYTMVECLQEIVEILSPMQSPLLDMGQVKKVETIG